MKNENPFLDIYHFDGKKKGSISKNNVINVNGRHFQDSEKSAHYLDFMIREKLIIADELKISNGLQTWPCRSFQEIYDNLNNLNVILFKDGSHVKEGDTYPGYKGKKLPYLISNYAADCSDSHVTCTVKYDLNGG